MRIYSKNSYKKVLPFVAIVLLSVLGAALISHIQRKNEEALFPTYNTFEKKFRQVSSGATENDVKRLLGKPTSVYKEDKLIPRGLIKKWEYRILSRVYTLSFNKDEQVEENPEWQVYAKYIYDPAYAKNQMVDGYLNIIKLSILFSCIYFGYIGIRKIYLAILLKNSSER